MESGRGPRSVMQAPGARHALLDGEVNNVPCSQSVRRADDDYQVMHGDLKVGQIYRRKAAFRPEAQWLWALNVCRRF